LLPQNQTIDVPISSIDLFPTLLKLCKIELPKDRVIDGQDILAVLQGHSKEHGPIFTCHNEKIMTIRDGDWKLYLSRPQYLSSRDLNPNHVDPKAPNGKTIIAQTEQPTPMDYPGVVPTRFDNPTPLFNLKQDPAEQVDLTRDHPDVIADLQEKYRAFLASLDHFQ
jgi:arylsulfatase A-like enzyme